MFLMHRVAIRMYNILTYQKKKKKCQRALAPPPLISEVIGSQLTGCARNLPIKKIN